MGLADPHAQSILGCPSANAAPEQPTPSGTAPVSTPLNILAQRLAHAGSCTCRTPCTTLTQRKGHTHTLPSTSTCYCTSLRKGMIHVNLPNRPWQTYPLDGNLQTHNPGRSGTPHITHPTRFLHTHLLGGRPRPHGAFAHELPLTDTAGTCTHPRQAAAHPRHGQPLPHASPDGLPHTLLPGS